jgi:AcrR family transcriptional regulator
MNPTSASVGNDERRTTILDAAWRLIAERGYHQVRVQDIARVCGTSTGTVHYYFPGKDDVLREALHHCVQKAFERQSVQLRKIDDARERMLALIEMQLPMQGQVRDEWSVWLQFWAEASVREELRPIHNAFYARWAETVIRIVKRGQRQGVFREVDPEEFALLFTSLTDGAAIQVITGARGMSIDHMRRFLVSVVDRELSVVGRASR